jgi:hypothetical protein
MASRGSIPSRTFPFLSLRVEAFGLLGSLDAMAGEILHLSGRSTVMSCVSFAEQFLCQRIRPAAILQRCFVEFCFLGI